VSVLDCMNPFSLGQGGDSLDLYIHAGGGNNGGP